ncbi:uncharacterized protein LOC105189937 [Harpegnathos saltator]|uniref:uncharacterized protein LOC105189937 n=1 Tax=Harpegnathos saltator TaxID=610380 RepID=UPI000DBEF041|nr:uncharacterized protein LOC105189937 [Harpegnathos saltator]
MSSDKSRFKDRFMKKQEIRRRKKVREANSKRWQECRSDSFNSTRDQQNACASTKPACVGNRIVNIQALGKNLKCHSCKSTLSLENIVNETKKGLHSIFTVICQQCQVACRVDTGDNHAVNNEATVYLIDKIHNDLTTNVVLGKCMLHAGVGSTELNKILACLDIPTSSPRLLKKYEQEVGPAIEAAARRSCRKAASTERKLVLEQLDELVTAELRGSVVATRCARIRLVGVRVRGGVKQRDT